MQALAALMERSQPGGPWLASPADPGPGRWPGPRPVLPESLERLTAVRQAEADTATLVKDIQDQVAELESAQAKLEAQHRRARKRVMPREAAEAAGKLGRRPAAGGPARRLLPGVAEARRRLGEKRQRLQASAEAGRIRKETLKAGYAAARGRLMARRAIAALGLAGDDGDRQQADSAQATGGAALPGSRSSPPGWSGH